MKLHKLILENINALQGKWQIDFDDPAFYHQGIFAILGATGSGKTSILDAICLAIYGATPRLGKISKSDNALMNLNSGHCQTEVWLSLGKKTYRFYFAQKRAKNKSDGTLQEPKHEIYEQKDDGDFELISEKKSQSEKLAPKLLGMDFTQFTRSVLLAQGGFAAFLQAKSEERGEILEKITGSDIYAKLSIKTFETHREKQQILKEKQMRLGDIVPMSESDFIQLKNDIEYKKNQKQLLSQEIATLNQKITQKNNYHQLLKNKENLQNNKVLLEQKLKDFLPNLDNLNKAKAHIQLLPLFNQLNYLQEQQKTLIGEQSHLITSKESLIQKLALENDALANNKTALTTAQHTYQEWQPKLEKLKGYEKTLETLAQEKTQLQQLSTQSQAQLTELQTKIDDNLKKLHSTQNTLEQTQRALNQFTPIRTLRLEDDLHQPLWQLHSDTQKIVAIVDTLKEKERQIKQLRLDNDTAQKNHAQAKQACTLTQETSNTLLHTISHHPLFGVYQLSVDEKNPKAAINALKISLDNTKENTQQTQKFIESYQSFTHKQTQESTLKQTISDHQLAITDTQKELELCRTRLAYAESDYRHASDTYYLHNEIARLQTHLHALEDGEPCPLCGSQDHPYKHTPPSPTNSEDTYQLQEKETALTTAKTALEHQDRKLIQLESQLSHSLALYEQTQADINNEQHSLIKDWEMLTPFFQALSLGQPTFAKLTMDYLNDLSAQLQTHNQSTQTAYQTLENSYEQYQEQIIALNQAQHAIAHHLSSVETSQKQLDEAKKAWKTLEQSLAEPFANLRQLSEHLSTYTKAHWHIAAELSQSDNTAPLTALEGQLDTNVAIANLYQHKLTKDNLVQFYDYADALAKDLQALPAITEAIKTHFKQAYQRYEKHLSDVEKLNTDCQLIQSQLDNQQEFFAKEQQKHSDYTQELQALKSRYQSTEQDKRLEFDTLESTAYEAQLKNTCEQAQLALKEAEHRTLLTQKELENTTALLTDNHQKAQTLQETLQAQKTTFDNALSVHFVDLQAFLAARLDEKALQKLEREHTALQDEQKTLDLSQNQTQKALDELCNEQPDIAIWVLDELLGELEQKTQSLETLLTGLGSNETLYQQAKDSQEKTQKLRQEINTLEQSLKNLSLLNQLIGSADGKKYRNFAQQLTLQALLDEANQVLQKMSDRYILTVGTDPKNMLDIEIIDTYQANIVRQSKNLSGGESFLVSLSLALGLSNMSRQNQQIDSLFLDEGFGTLDEEALDVALAVLSEIQSSGKMIGIISHVGALKERISTQIKLIKKSGGVSVLSGVGVSKLS